MSFGLQYQNGSFQISPSGKLTQVTGSSKFKKDVTKMLMTPSGGSVYGNDSVNLIGTKLSLRSSDLNLKKYLKQAIFNYSLLQKTNPFLSDDETLTNASVSTWVDADNLDALDWQTEFELKSGIIIDDLPSQQIKIGK